MSQITPTIGLKSPEGTDPFLTQDFIDNWDAIDTAIAADRAAIAAASDADTLGGHPASYFYSPDNEPSGGGGGGGGGDDPRPYAWHSLGSVNLLKAAGSTTPISALNIDVPLAGRLRVDVSCALYFPAGAPSIAGTTIKVDGVDASLFQMQAGVPDFNISGNVRMVLNHFGYRDVNIGQHTVSFDFAVLGGAGSGGVGIFGWKVHAALYRVGSTF